MTKVSWNLLEKVSAAKFSMTSCFGSGVPHKLLHSSSTVRVGSQHIIMFNMVMSGAHCFLYLCSSPTPGKFQFIPKNTQLSLTANSFIASTKHLLAYC